MLNDIRAFFQQRMHPASGQETDAGSAGPSVHSSTMAACALLVELAHADEEFSDVERRHLESALVRHFGIAAEDVSSMIAMAEEENRQAVDHFQFTRLISEHYDLPQKLVLAEIMWGLVAADGSVAEHEAYLVRKISNLLNIEPGYLSDARRRAAERQPGG